MTLPDGDGRPIEGEQRARRPARHVYRHARWGRPPCGLLRSPRGAPNARNAELGKHGLKKRPGGVGGVAVRDQAASGMVVLCSKCLQRWALSRVVAATAIVHLPFQFAMT